MLDPSALDIELVASALADHTGAEHCWLVDPRSGDVVFWTSDTGIDGEPVELDELDPELVAIEPLPSHVWFQDMADFAAGLSDPTTRQRLADAMQGRGAFRRFKNELYQRHPDLIPSWHSLRDARAHRRAVDWLLGEGLITENDAQKLMAKHPDPDLP